MTTTQSNEYRLDIGLLAARVLRGTLKRSDLEITAREYGIAIEIVAKDAADRAQVARLRGAQ